MARGTPRNGKSGESGLAALMDLPGVGTERAVVLYEAGYKSLKDVLKASVEDLAEVEGISEKTARRLRSAARRDRQEKEADGKGKSAGDEGEVVEAPEDTPDFLDDLFNSYFAVEREYRQLEETRERMRKKILNECKKRNIKKVEHHDGTLQVRRSMRVEATDVDALLPIVEKLGKTEKLVRIKASALLRAVKKDEKLLEQVRAHVKETERFTLIASLNGSR